jgi:DNA-binding beta-propeller fold protein YncE
MRITTIGFIVFLALVTGSSLLASSGGQYAPGELRGPIIGYVLDASTQAVRPVNGIPGSSVLGEALTLPFPVAAAGFSPRGNFALVISAADDRQANVLSSIGGENIIYRIEGAITSADEVAINADGSTAALVASSTKQLQIVHGLPEMPSVGPPIDLSSFPGTISAIAVDQAGSNVLIAVSDDHGALYLANDEERAPRLVANFGSPTALTLLNGDRDVIVADAAVNEITLVRNFATAPDIYRLAGELDGISRPAGLQISLDGRKLYVANSASRSLDIWNFDAQSIEASYPLDAEPTRLTPLKGFSIFVLNDVGEHPLLLLDAVNTGTYFVPAGKERN